MAIIARAVVAVSSEIPSSLGIVGIVIARPPEAVTVRCPPVERHEFFDPACE
jgi:hypothetical protein